MTHADIFESAKLRTIWYDLHGLLKTPEPRPENDRPRRKTAFAAHIAGVALALNVAAVASATTAPSQMNLAWPTKHTSLRASQALKESLRHIRDLEAGWGGTDTLAPVERSISVAEFILPQLPDLVADARAGVNAEGNVFLKLHTGTRTAYITVEPKVMHLLYMEAGQPNIYVDEEPFNGKVLPPRIRKVLDEHLKS